MQRQFAFNDPFFHRPLGCRNSRFPLYIQVTKTKHDLEHFCNITPLVYRKIFEKQLLQIFDFPFFE